MTSFDYVGGHTYHVILTTKNRLPRLRNERLVEQCLKCLAASVVKHEFEVLAYCFMPNHLHLLLGGEEQSNLVRLIQHFKQATGHRYAGLWQRSYYDHVLRSEERVEDVAMYIWNNPLAAGLCHDLLTYPYLGPREDVIALATSGDEDRAEALSLQGLGHAAAEDMIGPTRSGAEDRAEALSLQGLATSKTLGRERGKEARAWKR